MSSLQVFNRVYATLAYIRHFIFAGCYDNGPLYLATNLAGHLDLAGFYFPKCPANSKQPAFSEPKFKYIGFAWNNLEIKKVLISMKNPLSYQIVRFYLKSRTFKKSSILIVIIDLRYSHVGIFDRLCELLPL
jgi:hypothetical protein